MSQTKADVKSTIKPVIDGLHALKIAIQSMKDEEKQEKAASYLQTVGAGIKLIFELLEEQ